MLDVRYRERGIVGWIVSTMQLALSDWCLCRHVLTVAFPGFAEIAGDLLRFVCATRTCSWDACWTTNVILPGHWVSFKASSNPNRTSGWQFLHQYLRKKTSLPSCTVSSIIITKGKGARCRRRPTRSSGPAESVCSVCFRTQLKTDRLGPLEIVSK